jgi:hypothetical protein
MSQPQWSLESEHQEVSKEEVAEETFGAPKKQYGDQYLVIRVSSTAAEMDPGQWWIPEVGQRPQRDDQLCHFCTAQGHGRQGQCCKRNLERTDVREEMSGATGMQQRHEGDCTAGDHKGNSWDFNETTENECQVIVEGSAPSETKEETAHRVGAGDVGTLATLGSFVCTDRKKDLRCLHPVVGHDVERRIMVVHLN